MNHGWGEQADARMAVLLVVPLEELLAQGAAVLEAAEAIWEFRAVLHGAELTFRIWVVVGNIRPAVGLGDAKVGHQKSDRLGSHDPAAVRVDVELAGGNVVFTDGLLDELLSQFGAFPRGDHPAGDVAAEDVEDHVQIEVGPLGRTPAVW